MSNIRQRHNSERSTTTGLMRGERTDPFTPGAGLSAKAMIDSEPQHHGSVQKLHIPVIYSILPYFIQRIIQTWSCLKFLGPSWKKRHLILCGMYLYKFKDSSSKVPKGSPFEIEPLTTNILQRSGGNAVFLEMGDLPAGYTSIIKVSTLRRCHYYAVSDNEEALLWVRSLNDARQESITRRMGHALHVPYPLLWKNFDSLGKDLLKSKDRIKRRMEQTNIDGMEMTALTEGQIPRGFYG